jgi:hypothetical protein
MKISNWSLYYIHLPDGRQPHLYHHLDHHLDRPTLAYAFPPFFDEARLKKLKVCQRRVPRRLSELSSRLTGWLSEASQRGFRSVQLSMLFDGDVAERGRRCRALTLVLCGENALWGEVIGTSRVGTVEQDLWWGVSWEVGIRDRN